MACVGRGVCRAALLLATQGNTEAGTRPARPFIHKAGHKTPPTKHMPRWGRMQGVVIGGAYDRFSDCPSLSMPRVYVLLDNTAVGDTSVLEVGDDGK